MKIKVIASKPGPEQDGIENLIGKEFVVKIEHTDDNNFKTGKVSIDSSEFDGGSGLIILHRDEYEVVED